MKNCERLSDSWFDWLPAKQQMDPVDGSNCFNLKHRAPHLEVRHTQRKE